MYLLLLHVLLENVKYVNMLTKKYLSIGVYTQSYVFKEFSFEVHFNITVDTLCLN